MKPVNRNSRTADGRQELSWIVAVVTAAGTGIVLAVTDPSSKGLPGYLRVGWLIAISFYYLFGAGGMLLDTLSNFELFKNSRDKAGDFPRFCLGVAPAVLGYASAAAFILCYVNRWA